MAIPIDIKDKGLMDALRKAGVPVDQAAGTPAPTAPSRHQVSTKARRTQPTARRRLPKPKALPVTVKAPAKPSVAWGLVMWLAIGLGVASCCDSVQHHQPPVKAHYTAPRR